MAAFMSMGMISCGDDSLQSITEAPEEVEKPTNKDLEFALSAESENLVNNEVSIGAEGKNWVYPLPQIRIGMLKFLSVMKMPKSGVA